MGVIEGETGAIMKMKILISLNRKVLRGYQ